MLSPRSWRGQSIELLCGEELAKRDTEAVAQPLDSHSARILAFAEEYAFDGGLRHAGDFAQFVGDGQQSV